MRISKFDDLNEVEAFVAMLETEAGDSAVTAAGDAIDDVIEDDIQREEDVSNIIEQVVAAEAQDKPFELQAIETKDDDIAAAPFGLTADDDGTTRSVAAAAGLGAVSASMREAVPLAEDDLAEPIDLQADRLRQKASG